MVSTSRLGLLFIVGIVSGLPADAAAQDGAWAVDGSVGYSALVDDAAKNYWAVGGSVRRYVSPRISVGPELVVMTNAASLRDRLVMATGNVTFDVFPATAPAIPFFVAGFGIFAGREKFPSCPFWSSDPAFTVGGGVRARIGDRVSIGGEYRLGWELHHRVTATAGFRW